MNAYHNKKVLITGGLGFIGSNLARVLVAQGARVTIVDSLIPQYGGNLFNIESIREMVHVNICDVRDPHAMKHLAQGKDFLFNDNYDLLSLERRKLFYLCRTNSAIMYCRVHHHRH